MSEIPVSENANLALAERLSVVRKHADLTLDQAAAASGVSRASLSRIERAETSPTAATLGRLCAAYHLTMSELLSPLEADVPSIIARADAPFFEDAQTGFKRWSISPPADGYAVELVWGELPPKARVAYDAPPIAGMEQHIVMFSGVLRFTIGTTAYALQDRDCMRAKLHGPTSIENPGTQVARYLLAIKKRP